MADWRPDRDVSALFAPPVQLPELESVAAVEPFKIADLPSVAAAPVVVEPVVESVETPAAAPAAGVAGLDSSIQPFVWDESPSGVRERRDEAPSYWDDWRDPSPVAQAAARRGRIRSAPNDRSVAAKSPSAFESGDGKIDLTAGWDDLDQALADATPPAQEDGRFADLFAELNVEGIAPFDAADEPGGRLRPGSRCLRWRLSRPFKRRLPSFRPRSDCWRSQSRSTFWVRRRRSTRMSLDSSNRFRLRNPPRSTSSRAASTSVTLMPSRRRRRGRAHVSALLNGHGDAVAAALAETFPDETE